MTRTAKSVISAAAAACLFVGTSTFAEPPAGVNGNPGGTVGQPDGDHVGGKGDSHRMMMEQLQKADTPDKLFILHVATCNQAEMQWAQVAQQKSQNQQVKQVADAILKDHDQLGQAVQKLLDQQGLQAPQMIPPMVQQEIKVAQSLSGDQFDQCFLSAMKAGHMAAISKFEDAAKVAKDSAVKQFASQSLPALQQHAQLIQQAAVAVGLPSGTEAQPAGQRIQPANSNSGAPPTNTNTK